MKAITMRSLVAASAVAVLAACGGEPPAPPAQPAAPAATPAPKRTATAFAAPILEGKIDAWKSFLADVGGARKAEWDAARKAAGLTRELVWHQKTPAGDFAVVYQEGPDLDTVFPNIAASEAPIDADFMTMLSDVHGMDASQPMPANQLVMAYTGEGTREMPYAMAVPVAEGKGEAAKAFLRAITGPRKAEFEESRGRLGLVREHVWHQTAGDLYVVVQESAEPDQVMAKATASENEFDAWFLDQIADFTGMDPREPMEPNALVLDWTAPADAPEDTGAAEDAEEPSEE